MEKLSKSLKYAQSKRDHVDMVSEVEQEKFFSEIFEEDPVKPTVSETPEILPEIDTENLVEEELDFEVPLGVTVIPDVVALTWADRAEEEIKENLFVVPGQEVPNLELFNLEVAKEKLKKSIFDDNNLRQKLSSANFRFLAYVCFKNKEQTHV